LTLTGEPEAIALSPWLFVRQAGFFELWRGDAVRAKLNKLRKIVPGRNGQDP